MPVCVLLPFLSARRSQPIAVASQLVGSHSEHSTSSGWFYLLQSCTTAAKSSQLKVSWDLVGPEAESPLRIGAASVNAKGRIKGSISGVMGPNTSLYQTAVPPISKYLAPN